MKAYLAIALLASVASVLSEPTSYQSNGVGGAGGGIQPLHPLEGAEFAHASETPSESPHLGRYRRYGSRYGGHRGGGGGGYRGGYSRYSKGGHSGGYGGRHSAGGFGGGHSGGGFGGSKGGGFGGGKGGGFGGGGFGSAGHSFSKHHRKRSIEAGRDEDWIQHLLEASIEDENDCDKKFVCEVSTKPMEAMDFTELFIYKVFGSHGTDIDVEDMSVEFQLAHAVGHVAGFDHCEDIYARCNLSYEDILVSMKQRFEREESNENDLKEP
ncbi:hypothetical protein TCAL_14212 [Tigriopus californicus]|uniref:Peptidase M10 metallopeptidase domain-containing protein n=1 Tax=Tigriopus californicus TaxID=6832 RepID=A0A553NVJ3_TIGCA|nr:keratin, type I cytoskeletal 9-like [Tigriopus californicus]TRY69448.1 hypothetical protein TCAL_14212 [Tigriopus californicus]